MAAALTPEQRAERIIRELREATAEAAGVLKDLHAMVKLIRDTLPAEAGGVMRERIAPVMTEHVEAVTQIVHAVEAEMVTRFNRTQDDLSRLMQVFVDTGNVVTIPSVSYERVKGVDEVLSRMYGQQ